MVRYPPAIGGKHQRRFRFLKRDFEDAWGTDDVAWTTVQDGTTITASHKGIFLNVLRKQADGEWKLSHHMWDDQIER